MRTTQIQNDELSLLDRSNFNKKTKREILEQEYKARKAGLTGEDVVEETPIKLGKRKAVEPVMENPPKRQAVEPSANPWSFGTIGKLPTYKKAHDEEEFPEVKFVTITQIVKMRCPLTTFYFT